MNLLSRNEEEEEEKEKKEEEEQKMKKTTLIYSWGKISSLLPITQFQLFDSCQEHSNYFSRTTLLIVGLHNNNHEVTWSLTSLEYMPRFAD
jgi:hypothetical protein